MSITADYTVNVSDTSLTNIINGSSSVTNSTNYNLGSTTWGLGTTIDYHWHYSGNCSICHPYPNVWTSWTYPVTTAKVYMYQVECPKCSKKTFGELDTVITCKKCKSTIKLVSKVTDYEVAVDL